MGIDILTLAAARAGKGSGGSASKYKQPEWGSEVAEVEILPQMAFGADQSQGGVWTSTSPLLEHLEVGKEYTVNWNGKDYTCTAYAGNDCVLIGNGSLFGVVDETTDDPFVFMELPENVQQGAGMYAQLCAGDGSTYATISIKAVEETIHKLPSKYVEGVGKYKQPEWGVEENGALLPEAPYEINPDIGAAMVVTPLNASIVDGCVYTVNYGGVDYACTAVESADAGGYVLGNGSMMEIETPNADAPFMLVVTFEEVAQVEGIYAMFFPLDGAESCTFSIKGELTHKIPAEYVISGNLYVVKVSGIAPHTFDKPFDEIYKALSAGSSVYATDGSEYFPVVGWSENKITFVFMYHISSDLVYKSYEYNSDGTTAFAFGTIGKSNT